MALGDYILCCKCEVKLIYDGDRGNRLWWKDRFGKEPKIMCPDCDKWVGLTEDEIGNELWPVTLKEVVRLVEAKLREKNT